MGVKNGGQTTRPTSTLVDAVRQIKTAAAEKSDVVVEIREASRAHLELLAEELASVIAEVPADDDRFDFAISSGLQPRFWIDVTAHVVMAPDRRTYRFVRDTRMGRIVLCESVDKSRIAEAVTLYVATRMHERELAFAGDIVGVREMISGRADPANGVETSDSAPSSTDRIDAAADALKSASAANDGNLAAKGSGQQEISSATGAPRIKPGQATSHYGRRVRGWVRALLGGMIWILLGALVSGSALVWLLRDSLF